MAQPQDTMQNRAGSRSATVRARRWIGALMCFGVVSGGATMPLGANATLCEGRPALAVQVLGSGGPELAGGRASSGYLVWVDGRARALVDIGSGSLLRFAATGADAGDLELLALTHLHVDHVADLPALAKQSFFLRRAGALLIAGPAGRGAYPGVDVFLARLFGPEGAFAYLGGVSDGSAGLRQLRAQPVPTEQDQATDLLDQGDLRVRAVGVRHGPVPALAYRFDVAGKRVVFSGDQDGSSRAFWELTSGADLLVVHLATPEGADPVARRLHAAPSVWADGARTAGIRRLVLSHLMTRSERDLEATRAAMATRFAGPIESAKDLDCYPL